MNDVLVNTFESIFHLSATEQSLVQGAFFGAYFIVSAAYFLISSFSGSDPINRLGYKRGMAITLMISGIGCLLFYPAAKLESYYAFLMALFVLASGVALLQICANPFASILGSKETASSRLNLAQGFNSLGTTIGPLVGTILIYHLFSSGEKTVDSVAITYVTYGAFFIAMGLLMLMSKLPTFINESSIERGLAVLKYRHLRFGLLAIFFYVGSEVSIGTWLVKFIADEHVMGYSVVDGGYYLSYFWGGLMIGRLMASVSLNATYTPRQKTMYLAMISSSVFAFIYLVTSIKPDAHGGFTLQFLSFSSVFIYIIFLIINLVAFNLSKGSPSRSLVVFSLINTMLLSLGMLASGSVAFWSVIGTGLFLSIGWSNIFTLAIKDLGKYTSQASSLLIMMGVGGAFIPNLQSIVIESHGVQLSFIIPLLGMIYLIFYGTIGHKPKNTLQPISQ
ncbi:MAG: sugar MFS transporter [Salibacteraceae bacterium]